jgi:hypothetical protein
MTEKIILSPDQQQQKSNEELHWKSIDDPLQRYYVNESYAQWLALCVLLSSFAIVINNTTSLKGGEPKVATYMISIAIFILLCMTPVYVVQRWNNTSRLMNVFVILIAIFLLVAFVWLLARIWVKF